MGVVLWSIINLIGHFSHILSTLYSLTHDKILDWTELKAFADDKINIAEMMISLSDRLENIVGKRENAGFQRFLLFLQCFQKPSSDIM